MIDDPIPFDLTPKAYGAVAVRDFETPSSTVELWRVTGITIRPDGNGGIPKLPDEIKPIEARLFVEARSEAARRLGLDPQDIEVTRIK